MRRLAPTLLAGLLFGAVAVAWIVVVGASGISCNNMYRGAVAARIADEEYRDRSVDGYGTALYGRRSLSGDTRESCPENGVSIAGNQVSYRLYVPNRGSIYFSYAVEQRGQYNGSVEIIATLLGVDGHRSTSRAIVDGSAGQEFNRWHQASIDVRNFTGDATLELATAASSLGIDSASQLHTARAFFSCPIITGANPGLDRPDVIVISLDTLRADRLGIYGYARSTSPNMDEFFGRHGIVIDRTYSQATNTLRGHGAMLTGLAPSVAVAVHEGTTYEKLRGFPTLADHFRRAGYLTAAFTENAFVGDFFGFASGFDVFHEARGATAADLQRGEITATLDHSLRWIESHRRERKFVFIHTYQVHDPYTPPDAQRQQLAAGSYTSPIERDSALYDAEIAHTDGEIGKFLRRLAALDALKNTILVITSDHGEEFGEHGGRLHGGHLHEEVLRVPLLVSAPSLLPRGERRTGPAALIDLLPTLLTLAKLPVPSYVEGISLAAHLSTGVKLPSRAIPSEAFASFSPLLDGFDPDWLSPSIALTRFPYRVIRSRTQTGHRLIAFDLQADPGESMDRYDQLVSTTPAVQAMSEELVMYRESAETKAAGITAALRMPLGPGSRQREIDSANLEKLRALGYVE